ncbi:hypothetical protein ACH5RR_005294 [Cinchona calisaya]|uniref:Phorbol-ester/DAG-type domain-containing protein n=1 Tax=Cinchona calisaya TaxID=153742 RepID=A0ABD3AKU0_9GENT
MAHPPRADTIEHFTHPGHLFAEYNNEQGYLCDGCKTPGFGKRYRCRSCDFVLHDYCGKCPANLSISFMHRHSLTLVVRKPQTTRQNDRVCNVCRDSVEGLFYRCKDCDFDLHPICTRLPERFTHMLHQVHQLQLEAPTFSSPCAFCGGLCDSWRYRCGLCSFDMHLRCILVSCQKFGSDQATTHRGRPTTFVPPATTQYPFHQHHSSTFPPYEFQFHQQHSSTFPPYEFQFHQQQHFNHMDSSSTHSHNLNNMCIALIPTATIPLWVP